MRSDERFRLGSDSVFKETSSMYVWNPVDKFLGSQQETARLSFERGASSGVDKFFS